MIADLAATDFADTIGGTAHTPTQHKDLSAGTPVRLGVVDADPNLTFTNMDSGNALGTQFDVKNWSSLDYGDKTTFTSDEALGEAGPKIRFYWESTLNWTVKVKDKDGNWVSALGEGDSWDTTHRSLCVANAKPVAPPYGGACVGAEEAWEKVMQYSCDWAKGQGGGNLAEKKAIVDALWSGIDVADTSGTGARHDINYTFVNQPPFTVKDFVKVGCHGSCGHHARFFSQVGAAQGINIDVVSMDLVPIDFGQATDIAVGVPDVDGDWREPNFGAVGGPPPVGGNELWWYNPPDGSSGSGFEHTATQYDDGFDVTVYDPSFGTDPFAGSWESYMASAVTHYCIRIDATSWAWKTKADVNTDDNTVRWDKYTNYAYERTIVWNPVP